MQFSCRKTKGIILCFFVSRCFSLLLFLILLSSQVIGMPLKQSVEDLSSESAPDIVEDSIKKVSDALKHKDILLDEFFCRWSYNSWSKVLFLGREKTTRTETADQAQCTKCKRSIEEGMPKKTEKEAEAENELFDFLKNNMTQNGVSLRELTQIVFGWDDNPITALQRLIEWLHLCEKDYEEDRKLSHTDEKYLMYVKKIRLFGDNCG